MQSYPLASYLPDSRLVGSGTHHRISILASPRRFELRHVAKRTVDAPLCRRMRIRGDQESQKRRSIELAPYLGPAEEEALLRREAIDDRLRMGRECSLHRRVRDGETTEISDVLAERELTLHVGCGVEHGVRIELLDDLLRLSVVT